jgi:methylated-DNA-[protein]-cysteine S-methyltransferase
MPFNIHWVDGCAGPKAVETLQLPVGTLLITRQSGVITDIAWEQHSLPEASNPIQIDPYPASQAIHPWLDPEITIPLTLLKQGSPFRNRVWSELCKIPHGNTLTYAALAKNIGSAARAVGNACRDNPYALVIPCHRVVAASGMGGYCGQIEGNFITIKTALLVFEDRYQKVSAYGVKLCD